MLEDNAYLQRVMNHVNEGRHHTKIGIDCLIVEITRKCNMNPVCKHCMRGKPQNITLEKCAIDSLLSQVSEIGEISVTGGEPMLCLDRIRYMFEKVRENNITLDAFLFITNGLLFSQEFVSLIKEIDAYISEVSPDATDPHITIGVSIDQFHNNKSVVKTFVEKCKESFSSHSVSVEPQVYGSNPIRMGLAKKLPKLHTTKFSPSPMEQAAIAIWEPLWGTNCLAFDLDSIKKKNIPHVLCPIYLSATGKVYMAALAGRVDYETADKSDEICDMTNDPCLLNSVKFYNRGRYTCEHSQLMSLFYLRANQGNPEVFSLGDELNAKVNKMLSLLLDVQARYSKYSKEDQKLASEDMEMLFEIQREYEEDEISLSIAMGIWIERLRERGDINNYIVGGSPYTDERAEIINALLDIDDIANSLE